MRLKHFLLFGAPIYGFVFWMLLLSLLPEFPHLYFAISSGIIFAALVTWVCYEMTVPNVNKP